MTLYVARKVERKGLVMPFGGTKSSPSAIIPFSQNMEKSELDELVRAVLAKRGLTKESDVTQAVEESEEAYENRVKVWEAQVEVRRLMALRAQGNKLMQKGYRKWAPAFYRPRGE